MPYVQERLRYVTVADGSVHVAFPTALVTLCTEHDNTSATKTDIPSECEKCLSNARALAGVAPGCALKDHRPTPIRQTRPVELTAREREVLALAATGLEDRMIGERLGTGRETVRAQMKSAIAKLGARNRTHAVALAHRTHQIDLRAQAA